MKITEADKVPAPRLAHFVVRTNRFAELLHWYKTFFRADILFNNGSLAFLTFDEEHHRVAIIGKPDLEDLSDNSNAVDHVAFSLDSLGDLLGMYRRLRSDGIKPYFCINHGMTTSIYYRDPDGNKVEMQVDNFRTAEECKAFYESSAFQENPIGIFFDPDLLSEKLEAGVPLEELLKQGSAPRQRKPRDTVPAD